MLVAKFGVPRLQFGLTGETYQQQGVVDKSKAMAIDAISEQIRPVAKVIQQQNLSNDLSNIEEEYEDKLTVDEEDTEGLNTPEVKGFAAELKKLHAVREKFPEGAYEARKKAALKRRLNQTPGLAGELNQTYGQFESLNEYSLINQSIAAQKSAQTSLNDIESWGEKTFGFAPGWTKDPTKVAFAQASENFVTQGKMATIQRNVLELNKAGREELDVVNGRILNATVGSQFMEWMNPDNPRSIEIPDGNGGVISVNPTSVTVRNLSPDQKDALEDQLLAEKAQYLAGIRANALENNLDPATTKASVDLATTYYDSALGMLMEEGRASRATQRTTQTGETYTEGQRLRTVETQDRARLNYALEDMQRELQLSETGIDLQFVSTRYIEAQRKQLTEIDALTALNHPDARKIVALETLGVDTNNPMFRAMNQRLVNGYLQDPKSTFGLPENWAKHIQDATRTYGGLQVQYITSQSAGAAADHLNGFVTSVSKAGMNMTLDEQRDIMSIIAQDGVEALATKYPNFYTDVGQNIEKALPNMGQKMLDKMTTELAESEGYLDQGIFITRAEDGSFAVGTVGNASQDKVNQFKRKYVDTMNSYAGALSNVSSIDMMQSGSAILGSMSQSRMINLYRRHFDQLVAKGIDAEMLSKSSLGIEDVNALERAQGEEKVEAMTRAMIDGLYGEGAFYASEVKNLASRGFVDLGTTPEGYTIFEDQAGNQYTIRK